MSEFPLLEKSCKQLLSAFSVQAELRSYRRDFAELWGMVENPRTDDVNKTWVVVLDGWPDAQAHPLVDAMRYLGPRDWAVAWSLRLVETGCDLSAFKLVLLEPGAFDDRYTEGYAYVAQFPEQRLPALPWLAVFGCGGATVGRSLGELTAFLSDAPFTMDGDTARKKALPLRQYWRSLISVPLQPGDHHAISNLLAPLVLLGDLQGDVYTQALKILLRALGLLPQSTDKPRSWLDDELCRKIAAVIPKKQSLRLILVDDHLWQQGWGEVLCRSLGIENFDGEARPSDGKPTLLGSASVGERRLEVYGADSPACLPLSAKKATFKLNLTAADKDTCQEILLLDLRLFPHDHKLEGRFFGALTQLTKAFNALSLPWPGFSVQEIQDVEDVAERLKAGDSGALETPHYYTALTFLPRLLALADCSLPIILFSSTGRREIVEKLADYGNIITRFDKPRFFGSNNDEIAEETASKFRAALSEALDWLETRVLGQNLLRNQAEVRAKKFEQPSDAHNRYTAELYIDESGSEENKTMTVGGLLVVSPPGVDGKVLQAFITDRYGSQIRDKGRKKYCRENKQEIFNDLLREAGQHHNIILAGVCLTGATGEAKALHVQPDASPFDRETELDNLHRELTRNLCEASFYHLVRHWLPEEAYLDYKVYTATRVLHVNEEAKAQAQAYKDQWGINYKPTGNGEYRLYLSTEGTARALIERVMQSYASSRFHARPTHARGYGINDFNNASDPVPLLHYLTDALIEGSNSTTLFRQTIAGTSLAEIWQNGFISRYERGLKALLYAQRQLLKEGDYFADALRLANINEVYGVACGTNDIRASMKAELQAMLPEIPGSVLADLVVRLKTPLPDELRPHAPTVPSDVPPATDSPAADQEIRTDHEAAEPKRPEQEKPAALLSGQLFSKLLSLQVRGDDGVIYKGRCTCCGAHKVAPGDRVCFSLADIDGSTMIASIVKEQG